MTKYFTIIGLCLLVGVPQVTLAKSTTSHYSFYELRVSPLAVKALSPKIPIFFGHPAMNRNIKRVTKRVRVGNDTVKNACQKAAILGLIDLQKFALKNKAKLLQRVHSPQRPTGDRYVCSVGMFGASVILIGSTN